MTTKTKAENGLAARQRTQLDKMLGSAYPENDTFTLQEYRRKQAADDAKPRVRSHAGTKKQRRL